MFNKNKFKDGGTGMAFCLGFLSPAIVVMIAGTYFNWYESVSYFSGLALIVFQLYFLPKIGESE